MRARTLRIDSKEIMAYMRQLGCRSVKGGNNPTVKLDLEGKPLVDYLPEIRDATSREAASRLGPGARSSARTLGVDWHKITNTLAKL